MIITLFSALNTNLLCTYWTGSNSVVVASNQLIQIVSAGQVEYNAQNFLGRVLKLVKDGREALDMAQAITGQSRNEIMNDALEWYLPQIGTQEEEKRAGLLKEFRKKFPVKVNG